MIAHLLADPLGVDPKTFMDSLTCEQWDELKARHEVMPYDHSQKMLGLIAWMLGAVSGSRRRRQWRLHAVDRGGELMATLGDLVVNLGMNSQKFNRGMDNAKEKVSKFKGFAKKSLIAGIGAGVAAAGVIAAKTMGQMQPLDEMAKTADKLGIAANKMGGLQLAFEQTGVSANAGMVAMQRMTRRIADAANGAGPAAKALQELGLNANQLKALSPDQALNQIADAMKGVEGQSDKVRLAFSLFDSEGVGLSTRSPTDQKA